MSSTTANVSFAIGTNRADSVKSLGTVSSRSIASDSQIEFKRLLSDASEKKSAAQDMSDRVQEQKRLESERAEAKRMEQRQLEEQRQEKLQASSQQESRLEEKRQQEARLQESKLEEDRQQARLEARQQEGGLADSDQPVDGKPQPPEALEANAGSIGAQSTKATGLHDSAEGIEVEVADKSPTETTSRESLLDGMDGQHADSNGVSASERMVVMTDVPEAADVAERQTNSLMQNSGMGEVVDDAPVELKPGEVSLESIAAAVAAFTGQGDPAAGGLAAQSSFIPAGASSLGSYGVGNGMPYGVAYGASGAVATNGQVLTDGGSLTATQTAGSDGPSQSLLASAISANTTGTGSGSPQSSSGGAAAQAVEQALGALSSDGETDAFREGTRGGAGDNPLLAASQRNDARPTAASQSSAHFTVPTNKGELGQPEWHNTVAEKVAVMATKNLTSAEIQLDPPELGQLQVRVTLNQDQASVSFASQHAVVREALDQTAVRLREKFDAEGLNLVDVDVSDQSFQQQRQQQEGYSAGSGDVLAAGDAPAESVVVKHTQGLVDQFV
ncbi:flagellar hook-length control protein FliK [Pseudomaricurvus sp.]|uniref:flagellar hook-length control protein FliK n=1 Tax=Pseudomaricurvus sp. TaxID=2004510 RepID=UPI003F6BB123